jgi:hypothetical protein
MTTTHFCRRLPQLRMSALICQAPLRQLALNRSHFQVQRNRNSMRSKDTLFPLSVLAKQMQLQTGKLIVQTIVELLEQMQLQFGALLELSESLPISVGRRVWEGIAPFAHSSESSIEPTR